MTAQNRFYRPVSEQDTQEGYVDIFLCPMLEIYSDMKHSYIVELKYAKYKDSETRVEELRREAIAQADRYADTETVKRGKTLFYQIGCTACHRPSWTTGDDEYWKDYIVRNLGELPRYAHQKIWPYTDMVQHRLYMKNDIRGEWCRTTPLWGRGLSEQETGAQDRLHDCRARNVTEAIMWHGYSNKSDAYRASQKFYNLSKSDRDAVVAFINAI